MDHIPSLLVWFFFVLFCFILISAGNCWKISARIIIQIFDRLIDFLQLYSIIINVDVPTCQCP